METCASWASRICLARAARETTAAAAFGDPAVSVAFDASGGFLAAACASGGLCVLPFDTLRVSDGERFQPRWTRRGWGTAGAYRGRCPPLRGGAEARRVARRARFSPRRRRTRTRWRVLGRARRRGARASCRAAAPGSAPAAALGSPGSPAGSPAKTKACWTCASRRARGVSFAASGRKGRVFLWDARCAAAPRARRTRPARRRRPRRRPCAACGFGCDGQTVLAGTGAGRSTSGTCGGAPGPGFRKRAKAPSRTPSRWRPARTTSFGAFTTRVADALALAPPLSGGHLDAPARRLWVDAMRSGVDWCEQDPHDPRRVGFHLNSGWSGVLDLASGDKDGGSRRRRTRTARRRCTRRARTALRRCSRPGSRSLRWRTGARRRGSRTARGARKCAALLVGCPGTSGVRALDFSPTPAAARRRVAGVTEEDLDAEERFEGPGRAFRRRRRREAVERVESSSAKKSRETSRASRGDSSCDAAIAEAGRSTQVEEIRSRGGRGGRTRRRSVRPAVAVAARTQRRARRVRRWRGTPCCGWGREESREAFERGWHRHGGRAHEHVVVDSVWNRVPIYAYSALPPRAYASIRRASRPYSFAKHEHPPDALASRASPRRNPPVLAPRVLLQPPHRSRSATPMNAASTPSPSSPRSRRRRRTIWPAPRLRSARRPGRHPRSRPCSRQAATSTRSLAYSLTLAIQLRTFSKLRRSVTSYVGRTPIGASYGAGDGPEPLLARGVPDLQLHACPPGPRS